MYQLTDLLSTQVCTLGPREAKLYFCPVPDVQLWIALHTWCYFKNLFSSQKFCMERKELISGVIFLLHQQRRGSSAQTWHLTSFQEMVKSRIHDYKSGTDSSAFSDSSTWGTPKRVARCWLPNLDIQSIFLGQIATRGQLHHTITLLGSKNTGEGMDYRTWFCNSCSQVSVEERLKNVRLTFGEWRRLSCARRGKRCHLRQVQLGKVELSLTLVMTSQGANYVLFIRFLFFFLPLSGHFCTYYPNLYFNFSDEGFASLSLEEGRSSPNFKFSRGVCLSLQ